ncbi:MucBP domain-containing protein [Enterococcus sp. AZ126]|uniref:MucBP domain-containing protein n=1 Tax=Enterococcus sp. AZ126 TaxID=2774635 RepID=UPI003F293F5A
MKKQQMKKLYLFAGLVFIVTLALGVTLSRTAPIQASPGTPDALERGLEPVENEQGLKFTPKVLVLAQNAAFPSLTTVAGRNLLFSEQVIPQSQYGATYKYVDENGNAKAPSSAQPGFQIIYVEVTENYELTSIRVPIPVTVTDAGTTMTTNNKAAIQAEYTSGKIVLYPDEVKGKDTVQLQELVKSKTTPRAWNAETGEEVPTKIASTTISTTTVGSYKATLEADLGSEKATAEKNVVVFGADPLAFVTVVRNGTLALSTTPTNLFSKTQTLNSTVNTNATYQFVDENNTVLTKFDTSQTGFKWANVKMTDKTNTAISTVIKVPVSVTSTGTTITTALLTNKVMVKADPVTIYPNETKGKSKSELLELIESRSNVSAWDMSTGEAVPVSYTNTTAVNNSVGSYTGTITVDFNGTEASTSRAVTAFGADLKNPKYFNVQKGVPFSMGTNGASVFSKYQTATTTVATNATYQWVTDETGTKTMSNFVSDSVGHKSGYIKMTDKNNTAISTVIEIPMNIFADNRTLDLGSGTGLDYQSFIPRSDIAGKTVPQINSILNEKIILGAWDFAEGESLDATVTSSNIVQSSRGNKTVEVTVTTKAGQTIKKNLTITIVPDDIFGDDTISDWVPVLKGTTQGYIQNPINNSRAGFVNRGMPADSMTSDLGFAVRDSAGRGYVYSAGLGRVSDIPGVDGTSLYPYNTTPSYVWNRSNGLGWSYVGGSEPTTNKYTMSSTHFLRNGDKLKQIIVDSEREVIYVYDISLSQNLNFSIRLDMYNSSTNNRSFSMLESVDTDYYSDTVPLYALGNNAGFYMLNGSNRFTIKLKGAQGNWLSDYTKYNAGALGMVSSNSFGDDYKTAQTESRNLSQGVVIASGIDTAYQLGAPWKDVAPDKALNTGYEVFAGAELPYMVLDTTPKALNIYQDHTEELQAVYNLSSIPAAGNTGKINVTYPNASKTTIPFTADSQKKATGNLTIPRNTLPEQLNDQSGTIKSYETGLLAINETEGAMKGLPSNEYSFKVNVYNLGATPIAQTVKKDSSFTKAASAVVKDGVVLPGHTAKYEYVTPVDTSKVGLQYAEVKMTDTNEPTRTTIIQVPVMVLDGTVPSTGVVITAKDFELNKADVSGLSKAKLDALIIEKSEAFAWDVTTGLSDGIEYSIKATTLTNNPEFDSTYTATIQAKKGAATAETKINIEVLPESTTADYTVKFVDEKGNNLREPYVGTEETGTTIKLNELTAIQDIIKELQADNYDLTESPFGNVLLISNGKNEVVYKFSGTLKLISAPTVLDFDINKVNIAAARFTDPKVVGEPLVISDTRADKVKWHLKAKLDQPLTSLENNTVVIPESIKYNNDDEEITLTDEDVVIFSHTNTVSGSYDITEEHWSKGDGFLIDLAPGAVRALGKYQAKMTITLENAK